MSRVFEVLFALVLHENRMFNI